MTDAAGAKALAPGAARLRRQAVWLAPLAVLLVLPLVFGSTLAITVLNQMGIAIIFALSYNMLLGQGGMLSFGHAVYFGLGGFIAVHFMNFAEAGLVWLPVPLVPLAGGFAGLAFGVLFGSFSTNRAGTVFAMISLGIGELIAASSLIFVAFFGGEEGITGDRTMAPPVFGFEFARDIEVYYVIAAWVFVSVALMYLFSRTPVGRMANAVRDNPERAEFVGYSQQRMRFISFSAAGFFAGIAGGLFAVDYEILTEETVNLVTSGQVLLMAYIGGVGFFFGPIIGAIVFTLLQTLLSNYTEIWALYVGLVFLATVMYAPTGLTGILMMHAPAYRSRRLGRLTVPYAMMAPAVSASLIGFIGLLETLHQWKGAAVGETEVHVFWMTFDSARPWAWLAFAILAVGGVWAARRLAPGLKAAWDEANDFSRGGEGAP